MSFFLSPEKQRQREDDWPSKAVVACDARGNGAVLWFVGESLRNEIEEAGLRQLGDLGLDDAPCGVSVWEGSYVWTPGPYEHPEDGDVSPAGCFRAPTDAEWAAIREGCNPWKEPK